MKNSLFIILSLGLFLSSCRKEIKFEGDLAEPKLVINSVLTAGMEIVVNASKSSPMTSNLPTIFLTDATIEMWRGNQYLGTLEHNENGNYLLDHVVTPGNYRIQASAPGLKSVSAETSVPEATTFELGDISYNSPPLNEDHSYYDRKVEIIIHDPPEDNFYLLTYVFVNDSYLDYLTFYSIDPNIERNSNDELHDSGALINDNGFNGQRYRLNAHVFAPQLQQESSGFLFETINEDYARYIRSYRAGDNEGFFGEPVQYYTNVENGIGVFCGKNAQPVLILPD
ncbi:MAG: DUF4249 domain-containing protein [Flavobacteriales bacterium]|nr:DUF4249 domain-containing protein [Flavobacteriales bacterium]